jgi:hypothetical protein
MSEATFDLEKLMEGTISQLRLEADYFSTLTTHNPEKGRLNETHLVKMLRRYLPPKFGIGTGFIMAGGERIIQSSQCDIIIFDAVNNAPFYFSDAWQIYPIEMVYGVIEVKTKINKSEIKKTLRKCAELREMCGGKSNPNKAYVRQGSVQEGVSTEHMPYKSNLPPRFFIFGYSGPSEATIKKNFEELTKEVSDAHIHGFCTLDEHTGLFLSHVAFKKMEERVSPINKNGLWHFLMNLPKQLNSMLPVIDLAQIQKNTDGTTTTAIFPYRFENFDLVDVTHYQQS